jgi:serine/threonine protein kinase
MMPPHEVNVILSDFGEAFRQATNRAGHGCHAPLPVLPPEVLFDPERALTFSSDVWALACTIWSIFGMRPLFDGTLATHDDIASQQLDIIGPSSLPSEWWETWDARHEYCNEARQPREDRSVSLSLESAFEQEIQAVRREERMESFRTDEAAAILRLLREMLVLKPEDRATAESVVTSEWMVNWGLPQLKRVRHT